MRAHSTPIKLGNVGVAHEARQPNWDTRAQAREAGRLFCFNLYPFTHIELETNFQLNKVLSFGALPGVQAYNSSAAKIRFLESYVQTYLKEEVFAEQLVRKITPFKNFIHIAAQYSGTILNLLKLARSLKIDHTTVKNYFEILCDTHLGFYLPSFNRSIRKQQILSPKFYLFDVGVLRCLNSQLPLPMRAGAFGYGRLFEHFIILEAIRP